MTKKETDNKELEEQLNDEQTVEEHAVEKQSPSAENDGVPVAEEAHEIIAQSEVEAEAPVEAEARGEGTELEAPAAEPTLEEQLEQARQEATHYLGNWQRAMAELANFKRRQDEQSKLQRDRIKSEVLEGVISALDDLDLAFQNLPAEIDGQIIGWVEGFRLVQRKLYRILDEQNVMLIDTEGKFDPNYHEAVSYEPSNEHETDDIIAELRKGYQIGNRVIRPALVRVAS